MHVLTPISVSQPIVKTKTSNLYGVAVYLPSTSPASSMLKYWLLEPPVPVLVVNTNDTHPHAPSSVLEIFDTPPDDDDLFYD